MSNIDILYIWYLLLFILCISYVHLYIYFLHLFLFLLPLFIYYLFIILLPFFKHFSLFISFISFFSFKIYFLHGTVLIRMVRKRTVREHTFHGAENSRCGNVALPKSVPQKIVCSKINVNIKSLKTSISDICLTLTSALCPADVSWCFLFIFFIVFFKLNQSSVKVNTWRGAASCTRDGVESVSLLEFGGSTSQGIPIAGRNVNWNCSTPRSDEDATSVHDYAGLAAIRLCPSS